MMFMFPGQGSQFVGMGKNLYDNFAVARSVFQEVDDALGFCLSRTIFEGPEDVLMLTENAQPALLTTSIAALRVFLSEIGKNIGDFVQYVCGHSLGEYSAVCASSGLNLFDAAQLVRQRGLAMKEASKEVKGGMVAVIKSDIQTIESIISDVGDFCEIANDNSNDQIVISGSDGALEKFMLHAKERGIKKMVRLQVSAPFHSSIMQNVAEIMNEKFENVVFYDLKVPLISNVSALPISNGNQVKNLLVKQINNRVRWRETMLFAKANSIQHYIEFGPGNVLTNLVKKMDGNFFTYNVHEVSEVNHLMNFISLKAL